MVDVKWIKIYVNMFDISRKIKHIERMDRGDSILIIWFKLLTLAGKINDGGAIYVTPKFPYDIEGLADEFRRPAAIVEKALSVFEMYDMIEREDGFIYIPSWEEYQNIEGMERIREQNRLAQQRSRAKRRLRQSENNNDVSYDMSCDSHVTVTQCHAPDIEEDKDKEIDKDELCKVGRSKKKVVKHAHGEFKNVLLTENEYENLANSFGVEMRDKAITFLDEYIEEKGYKSKSHNMAIRRWVIEAIKERAGTNAKGRKEIVPKWCTESADDAMNKALERSYKTVANDPSYRERVEKLKKELGAKA